MYFQYDYGLFHENVTHLARLWLNYVHKCIFEVDFDQKSSYLWVLGLTTWTFAKYCFWSFRELYKLLLFDIVSFHFCIFVFVWSEKRPKNIVWSVLVTKKSTFVHAWRNIQKKRFMFCLLACLIIHPVFHYIISTSHTLQN